MLNEFHCAFVLLLLLSAWPNAHSENIVIITGGYSARFCLNSSNTVLLKESNSGSIVTCTTEGTPCANGLYFFCPISCHQNERKFFFRDRLLQVPTVAYPAFRLTNRMYMTNELGSTNLTIVTDSSVLYGIHPNNISIVLSTSTYLSCIPTIISDTTLTCSLDLSKLPFDVTHTFKVTIAIGRSCNSYKLVGSVTVEKLSNIFMRHYWIAATLIIFFLVAASVSVFVVKNSRSKTTAEIVMTDYKIVLEELGSKNFEVKKKGIFFH